MKTFASLFTGFGGCDLGAIAAGLKPIWGIEKDLNISTVAKANFFSYEHKILRSDVTEFGNSLWKEMDRPDWLHASPPCTTASVVNDKKESEEDIKMAEAVCRAIENLQPEYFSLENVAGYQKYKSFELIKSCLFANDYDHYSYRVLDCSDYGVPQTRKRLFGVFSKKSFKNLLSEMPKVGKGGWYDAIADLIPALKECKLTKSQGERLWGNGWGRYPEDCPNLAIKNSGSRKDKDGNPTNTIRLANEPIWTIKAMGGTVRPNPHQVTLIIDGKILRPSIECYARWQFFPDSYQFSGDFKLDIKGIGNAVPPLLFEQIVRSVLND